jgi:hypothetical protein
MIGSAWVRSLACAAIVLAPLALAQPPSLALPATGLAPTGEVRDAPLPRTGAIDVGAIEDAALAQADRLPPETWELQALALELAFDLPAMHAFVRDHVAFDPYPGVLRGAQGTLSARAGNAWDQALLLHALVESNGYDVRFAFGTLGDDAVAALLARAPDGPRVPLADAPIAELVAIDVARIGDRAGRDHALLLEALGDRALGGAPGGAAAGDDRSALIRDHVWVQAQGDDGVWRDLDPAAPYGDALTAAASTAATPPDDAHHEVVVRAVAETLNEGVLIETTVLEERFLAADAAGRELWFYVQPDREGVGGTVATLLDGASWLPLLMVDGEVRRGTPFEVGGSSGGLLGGLFGSSGPELVALRLDLEALGPGVAPASATRVLYDRAPPAARAAGVIAADELEPLPEGGAPTAFGGLHHVLVSTGGASPREHAIARAYAANFAAHELQSADAASAYGLGDLLLPLAVADQTLVVASERAIVDGMAADGARAFVERPRVFLASLLPYPDLPDGTARLIDLALDGVDIALGPDAAPDAAAHHRLWYGALQTALETEATLQAAQAVDPEDRGVDSVSTAMAGAALTLVEPTAGEATAGPALRDALDAGELAVLVGGPARFWAIDPVSGATRSVIEPGARIGFTWGRNYVNSIVSGARYVIDEATGRTLGYIKDGTYYRYTRKPPSRCSGGTEYVVLLGCVSLPASMSVGIATGVVVTAVVSWSIVVLEVLFL